MDNIIKLNTIDEYNELFGLETMNPLVAVVDMTKATRMPEHFTLNYGIYALFLKDTKSCDIRYGRQPYDYQQGTITSFAPGQVVETTIVPGSRPSACGLLFHPDLIKGTPLGREIHHYSFFSYSSNEALHLSDEERTIFTDCLRKIEMELDSPIDRFSKTLIANNIELMLNYCMRFYSRQFVTRTASNKDVLSKFEALLHDYFNSNKPKEQGLPSVKYFAEQVFLSPNYFGDLVKKETGMTAQDYIQAHIIDMAKQMLLGTDKTVNEISYELGFQYSQHFNRMFKKNTGETPASYRKYTA